MPEGDTVHKLAAYLARRLAGEVLGSVRVHRRPVRALERQPIASIEPHGKHLLIRWNSGLQIRVHLGMYGSWHRYPRGAEWHKPPAQAAVELWTNQQVYICFNAKEVELSRTGSHDTTGLEMRVGPDLLDAATDPALPAERVLDLCSPDASIAEALLDQRIASGIGNVYKSEVLFIERQNPFVPARGIGRATLMQLFHTARDLLAGNLGGGPRHTRAAERGGSQLWVYGRHGRACLRCRTPVRVCRHGAGRRSTYWCPTCQATRAG